MLARRYTQLLTLFLLVTGCQGLFSDTVYQLFTINMTHAGIEIVLALVGMFWFVRGPQRATYLVTVGSILMLVGALRLIPGPDALVISLLQVNEPLAFFNLGLGAVTIAIGVNDRRSQLVHRSVRPQPVLVMPPSQEQEPASR
jgi:hypothetical protein